MKRIISVLTAVSLLAFAAPVLAGDGYACTASAQECLDKLATKAAKMGYEGLDGDYNKEAATWTVTAVHADSPAVAAGFKVGDVIWGANGKAFSEFTKESWGEFEKHQVAGATVVYNVKRGQKKKDIEVTLAEMPEGEIATFVGKHMVSHTQVASNDSE